VIKRYEAVDDLRHERMVLGREDEVVGNTDLQQGRVVRRLVPQRVLDLSVQRTGLVLGNTTSQSPRRMGSNRRLHPMSRSM
jgi:hypothetical protein